MEREEVFKLVYSASAAKFFGVDKNSYLYKQAVEVANTISTALEKKSNEPNKEIDSVQREEQAG